MSDERHERIRALNDDLRRKLSSGCIFMTPAVSSLEPTDVEALIKAVMTFDHFTKDNDPHNEHDFGSVRVAGEDYFWKIDYFDQTLTWQSEDPADAERTVRVMTIMRCDEY